MDEEITRRNLLSLVGIGGIVSMTDTVRGDEGNVTGRPALEEKTVVISEQTHHLGDGTFEGDPNSQLETELEGKELRLAFSLTKEEASAQRATLAYRIRGVEADNELRVNGELIGVTENTSIDGSAELQTKSVPISILQNGTNTLWVTSVPDTASSSDIDDFEISNIVIKLSTEYTDTNAKPSLNLSVRNNFAEAQPKGFLEMLFDQAQSAVALPGADLGPDKDEAYINVDINASFSELGRRRIQEVTMNFESKGVKFGTTSLQRVSDTKYRVSSFSVAAQNQAGQGFNIPDIQALLSLLSLPVGPQGVPFSEAVQAKTSAYPDVSINEVNVTLVNGNRYTYSVGRRLPRYIDICPKNPMLSANPLNYPKPRCNKDGYRPGDLKNAEGVMVLSPATAVIKDNAGNRTGRIRTDQGFKMFDDIPGGFYSGALTHEFVLVPGGKSYSTRISGTDEGTVTIVKTKAKGDAEDREFERTWFQDVPVNTETTVYGGLTNTSLTKKTYQNETKTITADATESIGFDKAVQSSFSPTVTASQPPSEPSRRTLRVTKEGAPSGMVFFGIVAGGNIQPSDDAEAVVEGTSAIDFVGPERGTDSLMISGEIEQLLLKGEATVLLDDEHVNPDNLGTGGRGRAVDESQSNTFTVSKDGAQSGWALFMILVTGSVQNTNASEATIKGPAALDFVGPDQGTDTLQFSGEISQFLLKGDATVMINGQGVNPENV